MTNNDKISLDANFKHVCERLSSSKKTADKLLGSLTTIETELFGIIYDLKKAGILTWVKGSANESRDN